MKVRGVIDVDLRPHLDRNRLDRWIPDAVMLFAFQHLGDLEPGAVVVLNIGEATGWSETFVYQLAEALHVADTVQVTGVSHRAVKRLSSELLAHAAVCR